MLVLNLLNSINDIFGFKSFKFSKSFSVKEYFSIRLWDNISTFFLYCKSLVFNLLSGILLLAKNTTKLSRELFI